MTDGTGTSKYTYDQLDRLTETENGHKEDVKYEYDLANEQTKITYPNGKAVTRAFDKAGRLQKVTDWLGNTTQFAYNADSELGRTTFPTATSDVDKYEYNQDDQMSSQTMDHGSETLASYGYGHDNDDQVNTITNNRPTWRRKGRLRIRYGQPSDQNRWRDQVRIRRRQQPDQDRHRNLQIQRGRRARNGPQPHIRLQRSRRAHENDPEYRSRYDLRLRPGRQPHRDRTPQRRRNPQDRRHLRLQRRTVCATSQDISGTTSYFAWDTTEELPLILSDGTNSYIYGPGDLPVEQISNGGTITYLHHDQQGYTRLLTGSTGKAEATFTYGPYGALTGSTGTATTPLGYDGQYTNSDTGLIYLRARTYDPATAQFLSGDPLVALTGKPYAYAEDNPLNGGDPSGLCNANPFTGSFWSEGNCLSGAVGGPNGGGSQPGWWAIPAYGAIAAPCLFGGELACAGAAGAGTVPGLAGSTASMGCSTVGAVTPNFSDPSQPPGPGWEWRGNGPVGSSEGAWYNPSTNQSLHPDLEHAAPKGSHYDYKGPDTGGRQVPLYPGDPVPEPSVPALGPIEEP